MINTKKKAGYAISMITILASLFAMQLPFLQFDYDFESLFALNDPDLGFYEGYREVYGDDNDYLLVGFEPKQGIFDSTFLETLHQLEQEIQSIEAVRYTLSPVSLRFFVQSPMGVTPIRYLQPDHASNLTQDSIRIQKEPELLQFLVDDDLKAAMLVIRHGSLNDEKAKALVSSIDQLLTDHFTNENYYFAGKAKAQQMFVESIQEDFTLFLGIGILLMIAVLWFLFRSWPLIAISFFIIAAVLAITFGAMSATGTPVDVLSALIPLLLIIVSSSDIIHFSSRYQSELQHHEPTLALKKTWNQVGQATLLTSITTAIGFLTLITASSKAINQMGIFTALGVVLAFIITFTLLPAYLQLRPLYKIKNNTDHGLQHRLAAFYEGILKRQYPMLLGSLVIAGIAVLGIIQLKINAHLIDDLPQRGGIKSSFEFFDETFEGSKPWELSIEMPDNNTHIYDWQVIQELRKIETYLEDQYGLRQVQSPLTMVRLYEKSVSGKYKIPDSMAYAQWGRQWQRQRQKDFFEKLTTDKEQKARFTAFVRDYGSATALQKNEELRIFLEQNINSNIVTARLTGTTYLIDRSHHFITKNLMYGLLVAIAVVGIMLALIWRSLRLLGISIIVNLLPLLCIAGLMGYCGIDLSLSNAIIFAISFGIAVDDTLHFISKYQISRKLGLAHHQALKDTFQSTGKAILFTTIILMAGFLLFSFSSFDTSFYIGLLISSTLLFALVIDMTLLPVLLNITHKKSEP